MIGSRDAGGYFNLVLRKTVFQSVSWHPSGQRRPRRTPAGCVPHPGLLSQGCFPTARACPGRGRSFDECGPKLFVWSSRQGWCYSCYGTGREQREEA